MNITFIIAYVVIGLIAQVVLHYDLVRCVANAMVRETGIVFHETVKETGERKDFDAVDLNCDDEVVKNTIYQRLDENFTSVWKSRPIFVVFVNLIWICAWPIVMPLTMLFYRKYTNAFIDDVIITDE